MILTLVSDEESATPLPLPWVIRRLPAVQRVARGEQASFACQAVLEACGPVGEPLKVVEHATDWGLLGPQTSLLHPSPSGGKNYRSFASGAGLEHSAHVLEKGGKVFSATLGLVDIVKGTNSYYKLQLLEDDKESR